jgi:hypothetical protein
MGGPVKGEYYHFRCDKHAHEGAQLRVSPCADFRCDVRGCDRPAKAYWYAGEQFSVLAMDGGGAPVALTVPDLWQYTTP